MSIHDRSLHESMDQSINMLLAAKESAEDETARTYERLEQELLRAQLDRDEGIAREALAAKREAALRRETVDLERRLVDVQAQADATNAQLISVQGATRREAAQRRAEVEMLKEQLATANELSEMHQETARALEQEIARLHASDVTEAEPVDPTAPIRGQVVDELILENTRLEQQLSRVQSQVQDLKVTELVNETLEDDKCRLQAQLGQLSTIHTENARLTAKVTALESQNRVWTAFTKVSEYTTPQQLTKQVAELSAHVAALKKMLDTSDQVMQIQRSAAGEAYSLRAKVKALEQQLEDAHDLQHRLKLQVDTKNTHIQLLEDHIGDKRFFDAKKITQLEERINEVVAKSAADTKKRRHTEDPTDNVLDKLATKLLETEKKAQDNAEKLEVALLEVESLTASATANVGAAETVSATEPREVSECSCRQATLLSQTSLIATLERENEALKAQLQDMDIRVVPIESIAVLNTRLQQAVAEADVRCTESDRLVNGLKAKIQQTQLAEQSIYGYRLELRSNSICLVWPNCVLEGMDTSMDKDLNFFEFIYDPVLKQYNDLSYTSSVEPFKDLYQLWVKERSCLPAFLAAVLLQNYEKFGGL